MSKQVNIQKDMPQEKLLNKKCKICGQDVKMSQEEADRYGTFCNGCRKKIQEKKAVEKIHCIIPKKFWDIETDKSLNKYKDRLCSLFLYGKTGAGKTVLACSLAKLYIRKGYQVKFISYPAFIMTLQGMFRKEEDVYGYAEEIAWYPEDIESDPTYKKEPREGILIIDDLGAVKLTEFVQQITYYIINEREMKMLPTIITSNFDLNEIDEIIDPRVSSRIEGMCEVLQFTGKDKRRK